MKSKAEIFVFSDLYNLKKDLLEENSMVFVTGKLSNRQSEDDDVLKIIADDIIDISRVRSKLSKHIHVKINYNQIRAIADSVCFRASAFVSESKSFLSSF